MKRRVELGSVVAVFSIVFGASAAWGDVGFPAGTQTFESMPVGGILDVALPPWFTVNQSAPASLYSVVAANDVLGSQTPRGDSTRWLRITDADGGNVQNRFYSGPVQATDDPHGYSWNFFVNLETIPPGGASVKPKFSIQHNDTAAAGFANAWAIEFTDTGANLIVFGIGGAAASTPLYPLTGSTGLGQWVQLQLSVSFLANTVSASVNNGASVSLPINLAATADKKLFRFCYRGEGVGNAGTLLLDDVSVAVLPAVPAMSAWSLAATGLLLAGAGIALSTRARRVRSA